MNRKSDTPKNEETSVLREEYTELFSEEEEAVDFSWDQEERLESLTQEIEEAVAGENFEKAAELRDHKKRLQSEMDERRAEWERQRNEKVGKVGEEEVAGVVSAWTGIPVKRMTEDEAARLVHLEDTLHSRVIGACTSVNHKFCLV